MTTMLMEIRQVATNLWDTKVDGGLMPGTEVNDGHMPGTVVNDGHMPGMALNLFESCIIYLSTTFNWMLTFK